MRLLKRHSNHFPLLFLCAILIISLGISIFSLELPPTKAAATWLAYSNDPNTGHVGTYGANPVIGFNDPVGTWFRICNGGCTGYAQSVTQPQQYGGFKWIFDNAGHGNVLEAQPQSGTGNASCTMIIASGYRYCGVGMPDQDGDGVPDVADSCPAQGNQGYGVGANGCPNPIPDTDGDGVLDNVDACPTQGNQGYGVYGNGCPIPPPTATPIPDSDGDGILNPNDACPNQGNQGYGIDASGCPIPPPPPPPPVNVDGDDDGDGVPNSRDNCRTRGDEGYGIDGSGCPNAPPPTDTDGDGIFNDNDSCPTEKGAPALNGCPYRPVDCQVAFLENSVNLRSGPQVNYPIQFTRSYKDAPLTAISATVNELGETWYQLQGSVPLYVREDLVQLAPNCTFGATTIIPTDVATTPTPEPTETGGRVPPQQQLINLGCPIQPGEYVENAPDYILEMIAQAPDPCRAKQEVNYPTIIVPPMQIAQSYFDDTPEKERFFNKLLDCSTPVVEWVLQWVNSDGDKNSLERLIQQAGSDVCATIDEWRNATVIPLPPDTPPQESVDIGIIICSNPYLTPSRYEQLRQRLIEVWGMTAIDINCGAINSANRISLPSDDQFALYNKLRECQVLDPLQRLETLIMTNNDAIDLTLSCESFIEKLTCDDCGTIELPPELFACVLNDDDWGLMTLFVKNHLPFLTETEVIYLYEAINPCHAIVDYLDTGIIQPPIILPPPSDITPEPTPEVTPEITATAEVDVPSSSPPNQEPDAPPIISQEILMELGFDKPRENAVELSTIGVIFIRENTIYIREKGVEKAFDDDVIGEKYSPILFTLNNRRLIAYIVVNDGEARIRLINLNTNDSTFARLSDLVTPYHLAPLAYNGSLLVFTGIDPNGQYNLYGIPFSASAKDNAATLLLDNAMNATAIEGLSAFVFEKPNSEDNIFLWIPGRQTLDALDNGISGACTSPVGEKFGSKWRFWFLCEQFGENVLHVRDIQDRTPLMWDIGSYIPSRNPITRISLGELQGELFLEDGQTVYLYHKREKTEKVVRFINDANAIFTFSRE